MLRPSSVFVVSALLVAGAVSAEAQTTYYRSIGDAPDYTTGTVTAINGETCVVGSLGVQWKTENRGRGDRISIAGTPYTILSVDAENELTLTAPYTDPTTFTASYTISRKFGMLKGWEDCIEATALIRNDLDRAMFRHGDCFIGGDSPNLVLAEEPCCVRALCLWSAPS